MARKKQQQKEEEPTRTVTPIERLLDTHDLEKLSPKQRALARFIAVSPSFVSFATAAELGQRVGLSESTVVRFTQELGFASYRDFRQNIRHHHLGMLVPLEAVRRPGDEDEDDRTVLAKQVMQDQANLRAALDTIHEAEIQKVIESIKRARQIVILASGSYVSIALVLAHQLRFMGYSAIVEDRGAPNIIAALMPLNESDLVIGISFWRVVKDTSEGLLWAKSRGIPTIAIADTVFSPLVKAADTSVIVPTESNSFFISLTAPLSFVYALSAQLALDADDDRRRLMQEAVESFDHFKIASDK